MSQDSIRIIGAKEHNLKNIDITLPRNKLIVITGLSGSGKSTLAFDTLYAEGQRRYVESLSAYARQFLEQLQKPDVERIEGLSPAIAIEQRASGSNPRSIVATSTEIYDYLRLLYAHIGKPHCPKCGTPLQGQSAQAITDHVLTLPEGKKLMLLAPYVQGKKGEHRDVLERLQRDGFVRARIDGEIRDLSEEITLKKTYKHTIEAVVDRLVTGKTEATRVTDSVELGLRVGGGIITAMIQDDTAPDGWREDTHSEHLACLDCDFSMGEIQPRNFSFNSPYGACQECHGLGNHPVFQPELVIPDPSLSLSNGAAPVWRRGSRRMIIYYNHLLRSLEKHYDFDLDTPWQNLPDHLKQILLYGSGKEEIDFVTYRRGRKISSVKPFEGIIPNLERRLRETESEAVRSRLRQCTEPRPCQSCKGARLRPESLAVKLQNHSIHDFCSLSVEASTEFVNSLELSEEEQVIASEILKEVRQRLRFLNDVGLNYLTLNRQSGTLSGGEAQRIRLATQLGSGLVGVLYVLDEPTIGLHQRDNDRLIETLARLRDLGNTIVVVEHDEDTIRSSDYVVDLGPGAGRHGGSVLCAAPPTDLAMCKNSLTGQYLSGTRAIPLPEKRMSGNDKFIEINGAEEHNLKKINVKLPLNTFTCVSGVSGSGKSTLVNDVLKRAIHQQLGVKTPAPGKHKSIKGLENLQKMIVIDQSPIGRTPRSNPATYTDAFTEIRKLFAQTPDSRMRGYKPGRFSFNVKGGRCEECKGDGVKKIEMSFLPDVHVQCEVCKGKRYNRETLNVRYKGRNISEVLEMTVEEALEFFSAVPVIQRRIEMLTRVGLGYIRLGQPATTLSGGEAQRVKLATELAKKSKGHTLYILDEPTTGLHFADIEKLLQILHALRDAGNTVLVIEHNLDVIKTADHLIDLGPEGGDREGGSLVASGSPEEIVACPESHTGRFLAPLLEGPSE